MTDGGIDFPPPRPGNRLSRTSWASREPCPRCNTEGAQTTDSRVTEQGRNRTRVCRSCGHRWRTLEMPYAEAMEVRHRLRAIETIINKAIVDLSEMSAALHDMLRENEE